VEDCPRAFFDDPAAAVTALWILDFRFWIGSTPAVGALLTEECESVSERRMPTERRPYPEWDAIFGVDKLDFMYQPIRIR
jgi:hypothetical protein